jgi:aspartate carbamoyltransferase catalytic subunit
MERIVNKIDVLYVTRIQKERFLDQEEYERMKGFYVVDKNTLNKMKENSVVLHPLPRVDEISVNVDGDKRSAYFRQANNGLYIRMALLYLLLNK